MEQTNGSVKTEKECSRCKETKAIGEFRVLPESTYKDGIDVWCIECRREYARQYAQRTRKRKDDLAENLYRQIRNYFLRHDATYNPQTGKAGFLLVEELCDAFQISPSQWHDIRRYMIRKGEPIGIHPFRGHYYGEHGSQADIAGYMINSGLSMYKHGIEIIEAMQESEDWEECHGRLLRVVERGKHDLTADEIVRVAEAMGMPLENHDKFQELLIEGTQPRLFEASE